MTETRLAQVEREDLLSFLSSALSATGQSEFYEDSDSQRVSLDFLHEYLKINYRRSYAGCLALRLNHFNLSLILEKLLAAGAPPDPNARTEENALIRYALARLPPQRVYKLFNRLQEQRVNNRRTRATIKYWMQQRRDPVFDRVKYRSKVKSAVRHAHLPVQGEHATFLFKKWVKFGTPLYEQVRQARHSVEKLYELPFTVAEGLATWHRIPRKKFLEQMAPQMTAGERLRMQRTAHRHKAEIALDLRQMSLTRLCLYLLGCSMEQRQQQKEALEEALMAAAQRVSFSLGPVAAVLDASYSASGSVEKKRRPLAIALAIHQLLQISASAYQAFWTHPVEAPLQVAAKGQTDLATPLIHALETGFPTILIISDGVENDPPSGAAEILRVFRERLDPQKSVSIVHLNPVYDGTLYGPKTLSPHIPVVGIRDAEDLPLCLILAKLSDGMSKIDVDQWLSKQRQMALEAQ